MTSWNPSALCILALLCFLCVVAVIAAVWALDCARRWVCMRVEMRLAKRRAALDEKMDPCVRHLVATRQIRK